MMLLSLWPIRVVSAVVVLMVAAAAGWWFFVREDAQLAEAPLAIRGTPTASVGETPSAPADDDPTATPGTSGPDLAVSEGYTLYTLVSEHDAVEGRAEAAYFADEQLARIGVPSTAKGTTFDVTGQFALGPDGLDPNVPAVIVVGLTSLSSDEGMRDNRVRQALQITTFPTATFTATSIGGWTGDIAEGESIELALAGTMDLHGVQRDLTWDVIATRQGDVITALATTNFLYADFDIPILNIGGFVSVEEDVTLQVQLIAVAAS